AANNVLANGTGASAIPTAVATSTFFGSPTAGKILAFLSGSWQAAATTTFSTGLTYSNGNVTLDTGSATVFGGLTAANFNVFNNKVATSASETKGQLPYWTTTSGTPPTLGAVSTTSVSGGTGISLTAS